MPHRKDWTPDDSLVLVVAACEHSRKQVRDLGLYQCKNHRSMRPARYLALYVAGTVDTLAEIAGPPEDDTIIVKRKDLAALAKLMPESSDDPAEPRTLLRLKNTRELSPPIINDKLSKSGKNTAWTQYQGYTTIDKLRKAKRTTQL